MAEQLPLFGFKENLPTLKIKKMVSPERIAEVLAARKGTEKDQLTAMTNFREELEKFERRIINGSDKDIHKRS